MFDPNRPNASSQLQEAIDAIYSQMSQHPSDSEEYRKMSDRLKALYDLQRMEQEFELKKLEDARKDKQVEIDRTLREEENDLKRAQLKLQQEEALRQERLLEADLRLKLLEAEEAQKNLNRRWKVSHDVAAGIAGNLIAVLVIVGYERANVVTTKALGFLRQAR